MKMTNTLPLMFVALWSTGFVGAKFGLPYAEPYTILMVRMAIVVPLFICLVLILKRPNISLVEASIQGLVGLLIHGLYLGCVFSAINIGISAGLSALIVSMNPLIIALLSGLVLNTIVSKREWATLSLGLLGVVIVLYGSSNWQGAVSISGICLLLIALAGLCSGTLIQKRYAQQVDLITGSAYQYAAALAYLTLMSFVFETGDVQWTTPFIATMIWLVLGLSLFAVVILMYLIRHGSATRVASYFYLVPPLAAFQGWLFFDERWSWLTLGGGFLVVAALSLSQPAKDA